jgi:hypothetical protein
MVDLEKNQPREQTVEISTEQKYPTTNTSKRNRDIGIHSAPKIEKVLRKAIGTKLDQIVESELGEEDAVHQDPFSQRVAEAAKGEMFQEILDRHGQVKAAALNLSTLQRMNIHALQKDLVRIANDIHKVLLESQGLSPDDRDPRMSRRDNEPNWWSLQQKMRDYCGYPVLILALIILELLLIHR